MKKFLFLILFLLSFDSYAIETDQQKLNNINQQYEEMAYSIEEPLIILNPFNRNPLSALIKFSTEKEAQITFTIYKKDGTKSLSHTIKDFKTEHSLPILGLYANQNNKIDIKASFIDKTSQKSTLFIQTPMVDKRALFIVQAKNDSQNIFHYLHSGIVFDEEGHIRLNFKGDFEMLYYLNNEFIAEDRNFGLIRYDILGQKKAVYTYPENFVSFTHGITQKPNKNFLIIGSFSNKEAVFNKQKSQTQREFIIELDYNTGKMVNKIDLAQILNPDRSVIIKSDTTNYGVNNWCHINAVSYDAKDEGILISCRHSGLAKVNEKTKELIFILSPHKGFEKSGRDGKGPNLSNKLLTALDSNNKPLPMDYQTGALRAKNFKWPTRTHDARITNEGYVSVFDNSGSVYDKNLVTTKNSCAQVFAVDPKTMTVRNIWFYQFPFYSASAGAVLYDEKNNHVSVYASIIKNNEQIGLSTGKLLRFDLKSKEKMFEAEIYRGGETYFYGIQPFAFYTEEEN